MIRRSPAHQPSSEPIPPVVRRLHPVDCVYATAVLSVDSQLAVFHWAQSRGHGDPLILLDFSCGPLHRESWTVIGDEMERHRVEQRSRAPRPLGLWVEGDVLAVQAFHAGIDARPLPDHVTTAEAWPSLCHSAQSLLASGAVVYGRRARASLESHPFLTPSGVAATRHRTSATSREQNTQSALVSAFVYGIVAGLDEVLARDPHPKPPVRASRS